ncbi:MAG: glycosyltransferase family 4 protein [Actinobacteria bacterium]|nr:glycosyltransferase family 4 protein [Actinomycetota bacterium]
MTRVLQLLGPSTGGIRRHVAVLSKLAAERGFDVTIAGPSGVLDGLDTGAASIESVAVPASFHPRAVLAGIRELRALVAANDGFDVVHAHGLKAAWTAWLARTGAPIVLTVHNVVLDEVAGRSAALQRRLERIITRRVDRVIAVSPEISRHLGIGRFIVPASPAPRPTKTPAEIRAEYGIDPEALLVVVAARLHPQKDLPMFFRAWQRRADRSAWALVVGDGPDRATLDALRSELGLDTLVLPGASPHAVDELNAADLVVMSSRWEGAPLVIAEAMQLGKPIVSTRVGVVPDMVGDAGTIIEVGDTDALVRAIDRYLGDAAERERCGHLASERGRLIYGAEPLVDEVLNVYGEVHPL